MESIHTDRAPPAIGPYSQAIKSGNLVWFSGQIPLDPASGQIVEGGIREQTARVLENIRGLLTALGVSPQQVVKTTCFLTDLALFGEFNQVYADFFGGHKPARSTVQVAALPRGALVEIEAVVSLD